MQTQTPTNAGHEPAPGQFDADTSAQTQLLYQEHHASGAVPQALNRALLITLFGPLNVDQLVLALNECARKHEVLRARVQDGGKQWIIDSEIKLPFEFIKGESGQLKATEARLIKTVDHSMKRPIDLHGGPLWRATLFQLEPDTYVLLLTCHAIVGDTDTLTALAHDLAQNYQLVSDPGDPEISALQVGLDNTPKTAARSIAYWLEQQNRGVVTSQMPNMLPTKTKSFGASRVDLNIPEQSRQTLTSLAERHQCDLYDVLVCALAILVKRLNPSSPVALHCRTLLEPGQLRTDQITMSVPFDIDLNLTGSETIETVTQALAEVRAHPVFDATKLREAMLRRRDCQPVAISFGLVRVPSDQTFCFGQTTGQVMTVRASNTTIPFDLTVLDDGQSLRLECEYQTDSFDDQTVVNWMGAYRALLIALARESRLPAGVLEILDPRHEALIETFSQGEAAHILPRSELRQHLSNLARQQAEKIAIESNSRRLSWADCESMSNQVARHIIAKGIGSGQAVAVQLNDSIQSIVAAIACLKAQVPFVNMPVNLAPQVQAQVCEILDVQLLITSSALPIPSGWQDKAVIKLDIEHAQVASQSSAPLTNQAGTDYATAWFEVNSASANKPVCVPISWSAVGNLFSHGAKTLGIDGSDRAVCLSNPNTSADLATALAVFSVGATVLQPSAGAADNGGALHQFATHMKATAMIAPPQTWQKLTNAKSIPTNLKAIVHGVGLTNTLTEQLLLSDSHNIRRTIGCPETGFLNVAGVVESGDEYFDIGRPQPNTNLRILDERAQPCPIGVMGELLIGGPCVSGRYVDAALLSSQRFVLDQFSDTPGAQLFRTGIACAWRANGSIRVVDED